MPTETLTAPAQDVVDQIDGIEAALTRRWARFDLEADIAEHYAGYAPWAPADFAGDHTAG